MHRIVWLSKQLCGLWSYFIAWKIPSPSTINSLSFAEQMKADMQTVIERVTRIYVCMHEGFEPPVVWWSALNVEPIKPRIMGGCSQASSDALSSTVRLEDFYLSCAQEGYSAFAPDASEASSSMHVVVCGLHERWNSSSVRASCYDRWISNYVKSGPEIIRLNGSSAGNVFQGIIVCHSPLQQQTGATTIGSTKQTVTKFALNDRHNSHTAVCGRNVRCLLLIIVSATCNTQEHGFRRWCAGKRCKAGELSTRCVPAGGSSIAYEYSKFTAAALVNSRKPKPSFLMGFSYTMYVVIGVMQTRRSSVACRLSRFWEPLWHKSTRNVFLDVH
jgi:hypothetical protein